MVCDLCGVCGVCDMCVFECQSVVNSNKRGHAAGVTLSFVKVARSVSILDVLSFRFRQSYHLLLLPCHSILPMRVLIPLLLFVSCWTEAASARNTTKIANCVSLRSSPVPSPALCVGSNGKCDGNHCCPSFTLTW